jgi:hypothetical protein
MSAQLNTLIKDLFEAVDEIKTISDDLKERRKDLKMKKEDILEIMRTGNLTTFDHDDGRSVSIGESLKIG